MYFPFNCLGCGHENYAEWSHIGRQVLCVRCGRVATVPAPMEPVGGDTESGLAVRFACPVCGRNFATKRALVGQKIRCNGCGAGVRVPAGNSFPVEPAARVLLNANSASRRAQAPATGTTARARVPAGNSFPVANVSRGVVNANSGGSRAVARTTTAAVPAVEDETRSESSPVLEQIESIAGVTHGERAEVVLPSRAETMEQVRQEAAGQEAVAAQKQVEKSKREKKKKRKRKSDFELQETLTLVGGVSVVVGVLGLMAWYFPDFRYFLGGLVAVIGFILYLLGARSLRELAANQGFFNLMLYRFFPPYQLWFVLTHWDEARDFFAFFVSGAIVMAIGGAVITTSPTFKRAVASEREYQKAVREAVYGEYQAAPLMKGAQPPKK